MVHFYGLKGFNNLVQIESFDGKSKLHGEHIATMIDSNRSYLMNCAENVLNDFKDADEQIKLLKELKNVADSMVAAEEKLVAQQFAIGVADAAVRKLQREWQEEGVEPDIEDLLTVHANALKKAMDDHKIQVKEAVANNSNVKYLDILLTQKEKEANLYRKKSRTPGEDLFGPIRMEGQTDLELISSNEQLNIVDPVSKKFMTQPVRHTKCGHVYDKSSIAIMMKYKKNVRCPYMGCACKEVIKEKNLEPALDYIQEIKRRNEKIVKPIDLGSAL